MLIVQLKFVVVLEKDFPFVLNFIISQVLCDLGWYRRKRSQMKCSTVASEITI